MTSTSYDIKGMDCADCARKIEKGIRRLEHVDEAHVDFMTGKLHVAGSVTVEDIRSRVEDLGYELDDSSNADGDTQQEHAHHAVIAFWRYLRERDDMRFTLIGGGILSLTVGLSIMGFSPIIVGSVSIIATLLMLYPIARSGINNLRINHDFNINLLMTIAVIGAIFIGEMLEAAAVIFLFTIGEALEGFTTNRARESLRSLMALAPSKALVLRGNSEHLIPVEELAVGDEIIVKPGERIPMDGRVT
ncbi:MAG: cation-translocating P-type ATPase, partial [Chloroflexi bacterium]